MAFVVERIPDPDVDIFVPRESEQEYLNQYGCRVNSLSNGITIVSMYRETPYSLSADLKFNFPTGSYYDPKGKEGLLHFLEHLLANTPLSTAFRTETTFNASTNVEDLYFVMEGAANERVREYGVWPVLTKLLEEFTSSDVTQYDLDSEKKVIEAEIAESLGNSQRRLGRAFTGFLYPADHPENTDVLGNIESVKSLSFADILDAKRRAITPKGLYIDVDVLGSSKAYEEIINEIIEALSSLEGPGPQVVTDELARTFNQGMAPGSKFFKDIDLKNGTIDINYLWLFPFTYWENDGSAIAKLANLLQTRLHEFSRRLGISYTTGLHNFTKGSTRVMGCNLRIPKVGNTEELINFVFKGLKKDVIEGLTRDQLEAAVDIYNLRQEALPISLTQRFADIRRGLKFHGRIIDSDKSKKYREKIYVEDMEKWRDKLLETEPIALVMGDLS